MHSVHEEKTRQKMKWKKKGIKRRVLLFELLLGDCERLLHSTAFLEGWERCRVKIHSNFPPFSLTFLGRYTENSSNVKSPRHNDLKGRKKIFKPASSKHQINNCSLHEADREGGDEFSSTPISKNVDKFFLT